jgi:TRAP-type uncharacterized transport system fused permease subunit
VAYILPYVFIFNPSILMVHSNLQSVVTFIFAFIGIYLITAGKEGWWRHTRLHVSIRVTLLIAGVLVMSGNIALKGTALFMMIVLYLMTRRKPVEHENYDVLEEKP